MISSFAFSSILTLRPTRSCLDFHRLASKSVAFFVGLCLHIVHLCFHAGHIPQSVTECSWESFGDEADQDWITWVRPWFRFSIKLFIDHDWVLIVELWLLSPLISCYLSSIASISTVQDVLPEQCSSSVSHERLSGCLVSKRIRIIPFLCLFSCTRTVVDDGHAIELDLGLRHHECSLSTGSDRLLLLWYFLTFELQLRTVTERYCALINNKKLMTAVE